MRAKLSTIEALLPGRLSIMARPRGGDWLDDELAALQAAGVDVLVSLLPADEVEDLDLEEEGPLCQARGLSFLSYPIADLGVPPFDVTLAFLHRLNALLHEGRHITLHCRMGIGRAGLMATSLLVLNGHTPQQAAELVSKARGLHVPETDEQYAWIEHLHWRIQEKQ